MPTTTGVPGGALPFSGPLDIAAINSEWGLGTDLAVYHGARWYYDGNLTTGLFGGDTIRVSDFRGKRSTDPASGGTYFSNTAGSGSYTTSLYRNSITIEIWGAGGGGGGGNGGAGGKGGDSSVLSVTAGGGAGGTAGSIPVPPDPIVVTVDGRGGRDSVVFADPYRATSGPEIGGVAPTSGQGISGGSPTGNNPVTGSTGLSSDTGLDARGGIMV
jgi:hypothetical protein